jgi:uncharacterized protein
MIDSQDNIKGFRRHSLASGLNPKSFHLILFPTEQCNFRCVYCYEDFEIGQMPDWLVEATKTLITNKVPNLDRLNLSWFGGEPLLAKNILFDVAEHAQKLAYKYDCKLSGDLTTNGLLLDVKTLERLVALKQNGFQISIDGDKETHDQTRVTRTGRGSFDKIWTRINDAAATDLDFTILLRVHVTDINQQSVLNFCQRYDETLADDPRFRIIFKPIGDLGGNNSDVVEKLTSKKSAHALVEELTKAYEKPDANKKGHYICYACKPNSLAIRANGNLNKCTVALSDDRNNVGKINADGTLTINNQSFNSWTKGFITLDSWQMGCPMSYMNSHASAGDIAIKKVG